MTEEHNKDEELYRNKNQTELKVGKEREGVSCGGFVSCVSKIKTEIRDRGYGSCMITELDDPRYITNLWEVLFQGPLRNWLTVRNDRMPKAERDARIP
jgi:hypothetical protein